MGRFPWRPSRWVLGALLALTLLAPLAVLQSALPRGLAWPASVVALGYGVWLLRREASQAARLVLVPTGIVPVTLLDLGLDGMHLEGAQLEGPQFEGRELDDVQLCWRGPLAFLRWSDDRKRTRHLVWWPDTLPATQRRELKLAMQAREAARPRASMAP